MTNILLFIIAIAEVSRLYVTYKNTSKKNHFLQKLEGVGKMIWDLEFKLFKTREIREDVRKEFDFMNERIVTLKANIENFPKDKDEAEKKTIEDNLVRAERDSSRLANQLKAIDLETDGSKPTNEYPDGVTGILQQIESLKELETMLKSWIKKI